MTQDAADRVKTAVVTTLGELIKAGFRYPLYLLATSTAGGSLGMALNGDGTISDELVGDLTGFPIKFQFFDCQGKQHTLLIVDGDEQAGTVQQEYSEQKTKETIQ